MSKLELKRPEKIVPLCLDMSLRAEWEQAEAALVAARRDTKPEMMVGNADTARLAEKVRELEDQMQAQTAKFRIRAVPRAEWARFVTENPARDGDENDKAYGFNRETFFDAVMKVSVMGVTVDGEVMEFDAATDWEPLADEMTDQQYADFAMAIFELNRGKVSVPFSRVASRMTSNSDED